MNEVLLDEKEFRALSTLDIGQRIRYIRKFLYNKYGSSYSTSSVADRIKIVSTPTLTAVERGATKEPSARLIKALSKEFNIDMGVFFDDYYTSGYKPIYLGVQPNSERTENKDYRIGVKVFQQNEEGYSREVLFKWTRTRMNREETLSLLSNILNTLNTLDEIKTNTKGSWTSPLEEARTKLNEHESSSKLAPWIPEHLRSEINNKILATSLINEESERSSKDAKR